MKFFGIVEINVFFGKLNSKEIRAATGRIFQGKVTTNSCIFGVNTSTTEDRTFGLALYEDNIKYWLKRLNWKIDELRCYIRKSLAGPAYRRLSLSSGHISDIWQSKYGMTDDQGLREQHNMFVNMEARGKLNDADDREVWEPLRKRYGRNYVWDGSAKYSHLRGQSKTFVGGF